MSAEISRLVCIYCGPTWAWLYDFPQQYLPAQEQVEESEWFESSGVESFQVAEMKGHMGKIFFKCKKRKKRGETDYKSKLTKNGSDCRRRARERRTEEA